jgi:hypothetical protein
MCGRHSRRNWFWCGLEGCPELGDGRSRPTHHLGCWSGRLFLAVTLFAEHVKRPAHGLVNRVSPACRGGCLGVDVKVIITPPCVLSIENP